MIHDLADLAGLFPDHAQPEPDPEPGYPTKRVPLGDTYLKAVAALGSDGAQKLLRSLWIFMEGTDIGTSLEWGVLVHGPDGDQLHQLIAHEDIAWALDLARPRPPVDGQIARIDRLTAMALRAGLPAPPAWLVAYTGAARLVGMAWADAGHVTSTWTADSGVGRERLMAAGELVEALLGGARDFYPGSVRRSHVIIMPEPATDAAAEYFNQPGSPVTVTR